MNTMAAEQPSSSSVSFVELRDDQGTEQQQKKKTMAGAAKLSRKDSKEEKCEGSSLLPTASHSFDIGEDDAASAATPMISSGGLFRSLSNSCCGLCTRSFTLLNPLGCCLQRGPSKKMMADDDDVKEMDWRQIRKQFRLFQEMAVPYYRESTAARWYLAAVLVLMLVQSAITVLFSFLGRNFWNALAAENEDEFWKVLQYYIIALSVGSPLVTMYSYVLVQTAVHWREWMTVRSFTLYTNNRTYYKLENERKEIDNPDQRMAQDVRTFCRFSLTLMVTVLTSMIDLVSFSVILWNIYPRLFLAIVVYATAGSIITAVLGKPLIGLNFSQLQREADLRYLLVRIRENAESIAFYAGEDLEGQAVERRVERVMDNQRRLNATTRNLEFFTNAYQFLIQILPIAVIAPQYFANEVEMGVISQSVGAFVSVLADVSLLVTQFEELSTFSAGIERLASFYQAMRLADESCCDTASLLDLPGDGIMKDDGVPFEEFTESRFGTIQLQRGIQPLGSTILSMEKLDLYTPDQKRVLLRNLDLHLQRGCHLLIDGPSGAGKSSLLRAIAGLWTVGNGRIVRPVDDEVYFLPQRPYCTIGTLKDQLLYPSLDGWSEGQDDDGNSRARRRSNNKIVPRAHWLKQAMTDQELLAVLEKVDLLGVATCAGDGDPAAGLNAVLDWSNVLSLGEQQRLAFGRLLVNQPRLVILDEATSALDVAAEARMYGLLQDMDRTSWGDGDDQHTGITYVSVGHRPTLFQFHSKRLRLVGEYDYELSNIEN